jgi:hypothetical protein
MLLRTLTVVLALIPLTVAFAEPDEEGFRPLLNGQNLDGWVLVNTPSSTWTFQDGMLVCSGKPIGAIRTDRMYQNFVLELEWRHMRPRGNAGVFVWSDGITVRGVPFQRGIEVQILENGYGNTKSYTTHGDIIPIHGARMTPINAHRGRAFPTEERSKPSPEWNHYRVTCEDGAISLAVNGKVVTRAKDCRPRKGYICLESEGGIVHYRNLRLKELPDTPITPKHVATAARGFRSLYSGLDLSGWNGDALQSWHARNWLLHYDAEFQADDPSISTAESFADFEFVVDVRIHGDAEPPRLLLRGSDKRSIAMDPLDPLFDEHLAQPGEWNRLEGTLRGEHLTLTLNGHELFADKQFEGLPDDGPITISPGGPVDIANIFVRNLSDGGDQSLDAAN